MNDIDNEKIELLNGLHRAKQMTDLMVSAASVITVGGPDSIRDVVQMEDGPEMIITAIDSLIAMVTRQQEAINQLTEMWFSSMDQTDKIVGIVKEAVEKAED